MKSGNIYHNAKRWSGKMKEKIAAAAVVVLLLCFTLPAQANHIFGGELFYTYVSGNIYKVTMVLYGDCANGSGPFANLPLNTPEVEVYNGTSFIQTLTLTLQAGSSVEVSPVCPDEAANTACINPFNPLPGVKKFIYATNVTLSGASAGWRFVANGNLGMSNQMGRSSGITNVVNVGGTIISLEATLNNLPGPNSSPTYTTIPTPFFCINKPQEFNQGAVDGNGDSLSFSLIPGMDAMNGLPVSYIAPTSATAPLLCAPGTFVFNNTSGQLSFNANAVQKALVVGKVTEYRGGVVVGTSVREMTFVVLNNCNNNPPDGSITNPVNGTLVNGTTVKACANTGTLSFNINSSDPDGDNVTLSVQGVPAGAVTNITNNATPTPGFSFSWNLNGVAPGTYNFFVTFNDDGCPLVSKQVVAYTIQVMPVPGIQFALVSPATCTKKAVFNVTPLGTDAPYTLNVKQGTATILTRNNITSLITDSVAAGTYTFRVTGVGGCFRDTSITFAQVSSIFPQVSWTQPFCPGGNTGTITVTATGSNPPFMYAVNALPYGTATTLSGFAAGSHVVHVRDAAGCIKDTSITITNPPGMSLSLNIKKPVCSPVSNGQITVSATNGTAPYQYAINTGAYSATNTFGSLATGTHVLHIKDLNNCIKDTSITLTDSMHMALSLTLTPPLCFGNTNGTIVLNPSGTTAPYSFALGTAPFAASNTYASLGAGTYVFHIRDQNGCLKDTTVVLSQPLPLTFDLALNHVPCFGTNGGSVMVTAAGGTPAYQYAADASAFQPGALVANLTAGSHAIHLKDNNGCLKDTTVVLTQPASALGFAAVSLTDPTCEGFTDGAVSFGATGGTAPYRFALNGNPFTTSGSFNGLAEGSYVLHLKDNNGCTEDTVINLKGFPHILIDEVSFIQPSCFGKTDGSLTVSASGGRPPFSYQLGGDATWQTATNFSNKGAGEYVIKVKDGNQCIKDTTVTLEQPGKLVADTSFIGNDCNGVDDGGVIEVTVGGGTPPYQYAWLHDAALHEAKITGLVNGRYHVQVTDAHGCTDSATINILYNNCCTPYIPNAFTPNGDGRNDQYKVEYKGDMDLKEMYIYNRYGQRVFSSSYVGKTWDGTFNGQPLDNGTYYYYIRILCGNVRKKELLFKGDLTLIR
ncbi:T9SS type B sorting domain-containing protein [Taibaiella koreensis]|uniref:T9SS type B sorting domain-containing protein n=1 Tax=Taibaiella koreensis TaxID=1268548 RepID=UPI000E59ABC3|nr:gliding motility-associated C-terminal domain-containing protein [Taibaiella koreensis]